MSQNPGDREPRSQHSPCPATPRPTLASVIQSLDFYDHHLRRPDSPCILHIGFRFSRAVMCRLLQRNSDVPSASYPGLFPLHCLASPAQLMPLTPTTTSLVPLAIPRACHFEFETRTTPLVGMMEICRCPMQRNRLVPPHYQPCPGLIDLIPKQGFTSGGMFSSNELPSLGQTCF